MNQILILTPWWWLNFYYYPLPNIRCLKVSICQDLCLKLCIQFLPIPVSHKIKNLEVPMHITCEHVFDIYIYIHNFVLQHRSACAMRQHGTQPFKSFILFHTAVLRLAPLAGRELLLAGISLECECATTIDKHWTHSSAFLPSLGLRIRDWSPVKISNALGILRAPRLTLTLRIWFTSMGVMSLSSFCKKNIEKHGIRG